MAKRKRKTSGRSTASRRKNRTQDRMPAGLITLFAGLVLMALAFVPGSSAWRAMHDVLFGVFGCGSFVLGAALCYLAILYTRGEDLLPHIAKLVLGLIFASGTVIVFSDIPTDQTAAQMTAACYHNGMSAWLSGGALGAVLGGMMSIDMGGPFNKAAYVFGTAALASGNYEVMAAVMVGGMVPPIAIALSTTFCPKKWTPDERRNGIVNYVMGLCFVTEGAIPYAAADPLRVLPSCVAGAALAGALSMTFGCALRAPHGGIFVFPVVDHALLYCVALAAGSVVGAVILSLLKKDRTDAV